MAVYRTTKSNTKPNTGNQVKYASGPKKGQVIKKLPDDSVYDPTDASDTRSVNETTGYFGTKIGS